VSGASPGHPAAGPAVTSGPRRPAAARGPHSTRRPLSGIYHFPARDHRRAKDRRCSSTRRRLLLTATVRPRTSAVSGILSSVPVHPAATWHGAVQRARLDPNGSDVESLWTSRPSGGRAVARMWSNFSPTRQRLHARDLPGRAMPPSPIAISSLGQSRARDRAWRSANGLAWPSCRAVASLAARPPPATTAATMRRSGQPRRGLPRFQSATRWPAAGPLLANWTTAVISS